MKNPIRIPEGESNRNILINMCLRSLCVCEHFMSWFECDLYIHLTKYAGDQFLCNYHGTSHQSIGMAIFLLCCRATFFSKFYTHTHKQCALFFKLSFHFDAIDKSKKERERENTQQKWRFNCIRSYSKVKDKHQPT